MKGTARNIFGLIIISIIFSSIGMLFGWFIHCSNQHIISDNANMRWAIVRRESVAGTIQTVQYTLFEYAKNNPDIKVGLKPTENIEIVAVESVWLDAVDSANKLAESELERYRKGEQQMPNGIEQINFFATETQVDYYRK